jgi:hypothetical protein
MVQGTIIAFKPVLQLAGIYFSDDLHVSGYGQAA